MSTKNIKGIEIFARGKWNKDTFSSGDLDSIVESFTTLGLSGKVPLKLGHEGPDGRIATGERDRRGKLKDPMAQLAMGWVQRIYREDDKILADVEVPEKVYDLINDKYLKFVSVELFQEVRTSRKVFPWVLDAVALLGTDPPAVGILSDIKTLSAELCHAGLQQGASAVVFSRADNPVSTFTIGDISHMADDKITLEGLSEKLLALTNQVSTISTERDQLKVQLAEARTVTTQFTALKEKVRTEEVRTHRNMIKGMLEAAVKEQTIQPAARERFLKAYKIDDSDDVLMGLSAADVTEYIKDNPNPQAKPKKAKQFAAIKSPTDELPDGIAPDAGMVLLMEAQLRADGVKNPSDRDIEAAVIKSFRANPEAAQNYQTQQNEIELGRRARV